MIKFTAIKAQPIKSAAMMAVLVRHAQLIGEQVKLDLDRNTKGWEGEKPQWKVIVDTRQAAITISVNLANPDSLGSQKWVWNDLGTKPHPIVPVNARVLAFPIAGVTVFAASVRHPGTKPKGWSLKERTKMAREIPIIMQKAMKEAAAASGHAIGGRNAR